MARTSVANGNLTFSTETQKAVVFATPLEDTDYQVLLSPMIFSPVKVTNKTVTGFTVQAGSTVTGKVGWDVFV
jgi:hypothetical protein